MTRAEAIKIFKKYGVVHDILMEPYHNPKLGDTVKAIVKKINERKVHHNEFQ